MIAMVASTRFSPMVTESWNDDWLFQSHREYYRVTMAQLAKDLAQLLSTTGGRTIGSGSLVQVVDRTGIDGAWDVVLDYTFGDLALSTVSPSLEKLGLRLERTTLPVEKLIVDKMDRTPTEN